MIRRFISICFLGVLFGAEPLVAAVDGVNELIVEQLKCREKPNPLPVLLALEKMQVIRSSERVAYDSISCFRIHGGIDVQGMMINSVCAYEESMGIREIRPDLLYRGPGTAPSQFISFGTMVGYKGVQDWYVANIGIEHLNSAIRTEHTTFGDNTEISCKDYFRDKY